MRCSFGAGALLALAERHGIREPDILICASGSAGTATYYRSGQYDSIRAMWSGRLSTKRFINFARVSKVIDIDYLIDTVFAREEPLDLEAFGRSAIHQDVAALNLRSGGLEYLEATEANILEVLRATKAMPLAYKMHPDVLIDGTPYCDSPISTRSRSHVRRAVALGADTIITINSDTKLRTSIFFDAWMLFQPCRAQYVRERPHEYTLPEHVKHYLIEPETMHPSSLFTTDPARLERSLKQGYEQVSGDTKLASFLTRASGRS